MKRFIIVPLVAVSLAFAGCNTISKEEGGALTGAAVGGVMGSQFGSGRGQSLAIIAGALLGAFVGSQVGRSLDAADEAHAQHVMEYNRTGVRTEWYNPDSGQTVAVTPTSTYQTPSGQYCREYQTTITVAGKQEQAYGTACRQPDGSWKLQQQ